jgi:gamma-glutamylputrescine oxidase
MFPVDVDPTIDSLSYWHATAEPVIPAGELPPSAEVVVIGGGMLGCWTAYWLARSGVQVVLLEATAIGWGATGRNGGFLTAGTALGYPALIETVGLDDARRLQHLTLEGQALAFEVIAEEQISCELRQTGSLGLATDQETLEMMRDSSTRLQEDGFDGEVMDRDQVQALIGVALGEQIVGGTFRAGDAMLHSTRYLTGIARAAERHGASLVRARVTGLEAAGAETKVRTDRGTVTTSNVIVALNAWSDTLIPDLTSLVVPTRGQIIAYAPSPIVFRTATSADVTVTGEYWQQMPDGTIVIGGRRADAPEHDLGVREMVPTPEVTAKIEETLPSLFPSLTSLTVARRWAGPMAFTADYLPVVDAIPGLASSWFAGGFNGHGMPFGPRIGQLLAEAVTSGTLPPVLQPLRKDRPTLLPLP